MSNRQEKRKALHVKIGAVAGLTLLVSACVEDRRQPAPVVYRNPPTSPAPVPVPAPAPQPSAVAPSTSPTPVPSGQSDNRGVVFYDGYETIRANQGDDVNSMAARVGLTGAELAAYNGLSTQFVPQTGDELVLPARADGYRSATVVAAANPPAAPALAPVEQRPLASGQGNFPTTYQPSVPAPADSAAAAPTPTSPQPDSGWSAELARAAITGGAQTPQATPAPAPAPAAAAPAPAAAAPAPAAAAPAPVATAPAPVAATPQVQPVQPQLAPVQQQDQQVASLSPAPAAPSGNGQFQRPSDAQIVRVFSRAPGPGRNDGIDFATSAGDPVRAADDGSVALISKSLGGLGTIVLIRHDNEYLTVYGRLADVTVKKGQRVSRGEQIAAVADLQSPRKPYLHFEVRRGAESVDPQEFF